MSLRNLTSFCNSQNNVAFIFPCLEKVIVSNCLKLEKFSEKIVSTPNLEKVNIVEVEEGDEWYWEGDLNATIQKIFSDMVLFASCQHLRLSCYPELEQLWQGEVSPPDNCFNNLRTLIVENCSFLSQVFPSNLLPYFKNLEELQVSSSPVEVIFDMDGNRLTETNGKPFHLRRMILKSLRNLKCIWSKDPCRTISFQNLKEIVVTDCGGIKSLFPASLAKNFMRLKKLDIGRCFALEEMFGKEEAVADGASRKFEFHFLTTLMMYRLPSLKFFYPGRFTLECPSLQMLVVCDCNKLDTFALDFQSHRGEVGCEYEADITTNTQPLFLDEKVIPKLEVLTLNGKDMMMLSHGNFLDDLLHKLKALGLNFGDSYEAVATLPFKFFKKELYMLGLPMLSSIGLHNSWVDPLRKNLRVLKIKDCHRLTILVPSSAVSFCNLEELTVSGCHGLVSLFSSSVAKSLVRLQRMEITDCTSIAQIVNHGSGESTPEEIIFERLTFITMSQLPRLVCFYSGNATLEFSALREATIEQCPKMKRFSQGVVRAPYFVGIRASRDEDAWHSYSDLNTTVQKLFDEKVALRDVQNLELGDYPGLQEIWQRETPVPDGGFSKLKTLIVDGCHFLSKNVIPFHLLGLICNLEDLQVRNCGSVKAIFEVGSLSSFFSIPLKTLTLEQLPDLEHVWNEDPQEFLSFQSLQQLHVNGCSSLKSLFPASMAHGKLGRLEILEVRWCKGLVEIVAWDETMLGGATTYYGIFPSLTSLELFSLPKLKCTCPWLNKLEWPMLKVLDVHHCDQLKIFPTEDQDHPSDGEAIVPFEKGFPNIEQLPLDKEDIMRINCQAPFQANFLRKVKSLVLQCFHDYSDGFPYQFFRKELLPNLENLRVACSNFKEIFSSQRRDIDFDLGMLFPQLKGLELMSLQCLESIGLDQSWVSPILENLETLRVVRCPCLRNTVPSALSFSKLRQLFVYGRQGLVCLFTLSTARSLVLLEELVIGKCGSIQEIVPKKDDGSDEDELTFGKLIVLFLDSLQRLGSFHSGNSTLNFPCLKLVTVDECPRMRIFSCGSINASRHLRVSAKPSQNTSYGPEYCGPDLNGHIKLLFSSQHANCAQDISCLELCDHPELLEIWQRVVPVPNRGFCNLTNLTVHGCQSLTT
ncbi:uncharacterized protein LOC129288212 isoform X2 [Prosopis cineraria]|uniref:uncharacterized protein LOC129288212 isoform X2 n=1 Tax=Prosopis cineraria TaxID=364024 RepID=UPI00240EBBFD|nr:uncharacterized protein LOC129288212 isoform X2 [Prosopis cineraria]